MFWRGAPLGAGQLACVRPVCGSCCGLHGALDGKGQWSHNVERVPGAGGPRRGLAVPVRPCGYGAETQSTGARGARWMEGTWGQAGEAQAAGILARPLRACPQVAGSVLSPGTWRRLGSASG